jgi:sulfatase modifying factor 1
MRAWALALVVVMGVAARGVADTIVINNGLAPPNPDNVIDAGNSYPGDWVYVQNVGCDATVEYPCPLPWGDATSVELVEGGEVLSLFTYETSTVTVSGGSLSYLQARDSSIVTLSGGSVGSLSADGSIVTMIDGSVADYLAASGSSTVALSGGTVGSLVAGDSTVTMSGGSVEAGLDAVGSSIVTLSGGSVGHLEAKDSSTVTLSGGSVGHLEAKDSSTVTLRGGEVGGYLIADDASSVVMSGGSVIRLQASDTSSVILSGGSVRDFVVAEGSSRVTMRGGSVQGVYTFFGDLLADDSSRFTIIGTDFAVDGVPVAYGPISATEGRLTGTLASGEPLDNDFCRGCLGHTGLIQLAFIDWVEVGDPGNPADTAANCFADSCGSVSYEYYISTYEVTNAQYAEFLNAKAADNADPLGLYNTAMARHGITRSGSPGAYAYTVNTGFADKPVNYVSFYDALRFANWLNNGQGDGNTETGAYTLLGGTATPSNGLTVTRNPGAITFLPSENEWYKAAYFDPSTGSYFQYPAGSDAMTTCEMPGSTPNTANCGLLPGISGFPLGVTPVGAYAVSPSPYGTFDQGGNVWEWNEEGIWGGAGRGIRGGSWGSFDSYLAASERPAIPSSFEEADLGFRVASLVPEPDVSLVGLTSLACLTALARRRPRSRPEPELLL